jgi:hypothetical protein
MSEFKFACPVCGQHITADSQAAGTELDCPTCFRRLVVPQAPAASGSKLILSAAQASKPRQISTAQPESDHADLHSTSSPRIGVIVLALGLVVLAATTTAFLRWRGELLIHALNRQEIVVEPSPVYPVPTNTFWTLEPAQAATPDGTVVGSVHGNGFFCERAILRGGLLSLRQGKVWPPDLGISVRFFTEQAEDLSGKTIAIAPGRRPPLPEVVLRWKDDQNQSVAERFGEGYALKLTFGQPANGRIPGRIFIALPDGARSFAAGTFDAVIRKPVPPKGEKSSQ